jgi:hypothetical protein
MMKTTDRTVDDRPRPLLVRMPRTRRRRAALTAAAALAGALAGAAVVAMAYEAAARLVTP